MFKKQIETTNAPAAIGPYSQAIRVGDFLFYSGQIPLDPATGALVEGGIEEQTRQVLANMRAMLKASRLDYDDIVKTTIYLTDLADFTTVNEIYGACFHEQPPARACVQVAALPKGARIEVEWIAVAQV
ncbi:MAG: RidA family protein [Desulfuromonadales bacterium]|jgi:2-iminobutanoate/2-iminopropanoate deaminase